MSKQLKITIIAASWLMIALLLISYKQWILHSGEQILLETQPVDPYDILKGDYIRLNYGVSTVPGRTLEGDRLEKGKRYYVILEKRGKHYFEATGVSQRKPEDGIFLLGKWRSNRMEYGIEEFFVPEGRGKEIERLCGKGLTVEVAVTGSGISAISRLFFNDEEVKIRD